VIRPFRTSAPCAWLQSALGRAWDTGPLTDRREADPATRTGHPLAPAIRTTRPLSPAPPKEYP
jgi:hypothetical protein